MDFYNFNHIGNDAVNRCDQFHRSPANFSIWELTDISNPKRPFPKDSNNANFQFNSKKFENAYFKLDGKDVTMQKIEDYLKELNHLDKSYNHSSRAQKAKTRQRLYQEGNLFAKHSTGKLITSKLDFEQHAGKFYSNY